MVLVNFPEYTGPEFFQDQPHLVPVCPVTFAEGGSSRTMFPIKLELQAKLLNYFLGSNKSNINQLGFVLLVTSLKDLHVG